MSLSVQPLEALPKRTVSPGAGRVREANPFDELLLNAHEGKAAQQFLLPAKQILANFTGTDKLSPTEVAVRTARKAAVYLHIGLDTVIQEDGSVAFRVRDKRIVNRESKPETASV